MTEYLTVLGTEMEIKSISAYDYAQARRKANTAEKNGEPDAALSFWADIIANALYDGDNRAFSSADEVMKSLTLDEIAEISAEFSFPELSIPQKTERFGEEDSDIATKDSKLDITFGAAQNGVLSFVTNSTSAQNERKASFMDYQRISDFFERDSRRYDGIFKTEENI